MPVLPHSARSGSVVTWPVRSGVVPPLAAFYCPRPETGFAAGTSPADEPPSPLVPAREAGSYVLTGPSGSGKTQLAVSYAQALWQAGDIELLVWVTGSSRTAVLTGLAEGFYQVSQAPDGPGPAGAVARRPRYGTGDDLEELAARFLDWLKASSRPWLVIMDDLADATDLADLWPQGPEGRVVLTTRLLPASIAPPGRRARLIQIGPFSRREALSYLTGRLYEDTGQRNGALDLAEALSCLPIALAQAAALIADRQIDCREYRQMFTARQQAMGIGPDRGPAATVAVTWSLALDRADQLMLSALARPLLALLALLDSGGVPAAVLASPAARDYIGGYAPDRAPATDQQVSEILAGLTRVGLLTADPAEPARTIYLHALVQASIRQVLPDEVRDQAALAAATALAQTWPERDAGAALDQALRDCAAALTQAAGPVLREPPHPLLLRAGQSLDTARLGHAAIAYWQAMTQAAGEDDHTGNTRVLEYKEHLAAAHEAAGQIELAIEVLTGSLAEREETLGQGHPGTLTARAQLARGFVAAGRLNEAIPQFERTLAGREWVLGPNHAQTLEARRDLAGAYAAAGHGEDAITVYRRTLADQEVILGEDHPETTGTRGSLAAALHTAGRMTDAIPLYARTLADRERVLGPDDPDTIAARASLAYAYRCVGKLKDAIPLYARTLADRERVLGPDHLDTITSRANLATAYYAARKLKEAIGEYERTLADRERVQGADHPDTLTARGNLASAYHSAGRLVKATELYESTLADYERVLGPRHENTLTSRANLALAYHAARRSTDAIALFRRTLSDCELELPPGHPLTESVRESLDTACRS